MKTAEEYEVELSFYKSSLAKIAADFDIISYWQFVALAKDNSQTVVDILREHIAKVRKTEKLDAKRAGMTEAAELVKPSRHPCGTRINHNELQAENYRVIISARDNLKEI